MRREILFVIGPESSGTRGTTKIFIDRGYWGQDSHIQLLDEFILGRKPIDEIIPVNVEKIVFRRSVPHAGVYPDLSKIDTMFLTSGFKTRWIIVFRDLAELIRSKIHRGWSSDFDEAGYKSMIEYKFIFEKASLKSNVDFFPFSFLIKNKEKIDPFLISLGLINK